MSCAWDLWCRTCNASTDLNLNHGEVDLQRLVSGGGVQLIADLYKLDTNVRVELWERAIGDWCIRHAGHDIVVRNEYGDLYGACAHGFPCKTCGAQQRCVLAPGHAGEHARAAPEPGHLPTDQEMLGVALKTRAIELLLAERTELGDPPELRAQYHAMLESRVTEADRAAAVQMLKSILSRTTDSAILMHAFGALARLVNEHGS